MDEATSKKLANVLVSAMFVDDPTMQNLLPPAMTASHDAVTPSAC